MSGLTAPLMSSAGESLGTIPLPDRMFAQPVSRALLHEVVVHALAARRRGTHETKTRTDVSGGGKKPWKQKHTGRARAGSIRSPLWRHGGVVFGPHNRNHAVEVPSRKIRAALTGALTRRGEAGDVLVVDQFTVQSGRTRDVASLLRKLGVTLPVLLVVSEVDANLARAAGNIQGVRIRMPDHLTPYETLRVSKIIITKPALEKLGGAS